MVFLLEISNLYLQREPVFLHGDCHVSPPCSYKSPERAMLLNSTHWTFDLFLFSMRSMTSGPIQYIHSCSCFMFNIMVGNCCLFLSSAVWAPLKNRNPLPTIILNMFQEQELYLPICVVLSATWHCPHPDLHGLSSAPTRLIQALPFRRDAMWLCANITLFGENPDIYVYDKTLWLPIVFFFGC